MEAVVDRLVTVVRCSTDRVAIAASRECGGWGILRTKKDDEHVIKVIKKTFECAKIPSSIAK
jgi:hypothetical protein